MKLLSNNNEKKNIGYDLPICYLRTVGYIGTYAFANNAIQTATFPAGYVCVCVINIIIIANNELSCFFFYPAVPFLRLSFLGAAAFEYNALKNVTFRGYVR